MALPKIDQPIFTMIMSSTQKKVKYRPFTVKEEKILLIAQESKDVEQSINAIKQIITNCVFDVDVDNMPLFDLEYCLITIRSKSVNNEIEFTVNDPDTEERVKLALDLNKMNVVFNENHKNVIEVSPNMHLKMRYPTLTEMQALVNSNDKEAMFNAMVSCMETLVNEEEVYKLSESSDEELLEFVDSLSTEAIQNVRQFFDTMPKLRHEIKYVNKNNDEKTFVLEGMDNFFI